MFLFSFEVKYNFEEQSATTFTENLDFTIYIFIVKKFWNLYIIMHLFSKK